MSIRELSFTSREPILQLPYIRQELRLQQAVSPAELPGTLGRLANRLQKQHRLPIFFDPLNAALFSPIALPHESESFTIIKQETVNLAASSYSRLFFQVCNFALYRAFKKASNPPKIDFYRKRIYSKIEKLSDSIEAQKYLIFDFIRDEQQHLIFIPDFANEYRSILTLDSLNLQDLQPGQKLIDTYEGKSCEFLGVAGETIATPLPELGNKSLIEYHREKNYISQSLLNSLDLSTPALEVRYYQSGKPPFKAKHIPHLLKKVYDRRDIDSRSFEQQLWPIDKKVEKAKETIKFINKNNKFFLDCQNKESLIVSFGNELRLPANLQKFNSPKLNFGNKVIVSYPTAALKGGHLWQKPEEVKTVILAPPSWEDRVRQYIAPLKEEFGRFGINLRRNLQFYNPVEELEIIQTCHNLINCDFVIAFVPESEHPEYVRQVNPYKRIKSQLIARNIPSQMINYDTLQKGWNEHIAYNLILGINAKLGYLNWKLTDLPGTAQAFVGLDIGRKNNRSVGASAFVLDAQGELIGWSTQDLVANQETFDTEALRNFLLDLISLYQIEYQQPLKHLVIHRDGKLQNSEYQVLVELKEYLKPAGLEQLDVVEVIKTGTCRAIKLTEQGNCQNPDKGYAWNYCDQEAIILTTGEWEAKVNRSNSSPRPLRIRRRLGETDLMVLAEQIYWLSEMQVGSTQTIRLPITTYYADRAAEWVLEGLLPSQIRRDKRLWFL